MSKVFENSNISTIKLKNRIIRSATHENLADEFGKPSDKLTKMYTTLAQNNVGLIITGYAGVLQNGKSSCGNMLMIDKDEHIEDYKKLVNEVHEYDTPIILQLVHCGRQTNSEIIGCTKVAPSAIKDKFYNESIPQELSENQILEIINSFVQSIIRAQKAGFDGVQLHLAHGFLLSSFLSPHMNKRKDKWGGSTENRFRIVSEIFRLARENVGNYPILAKINVFEKSQDGIKLNEAIKIAKLLEQSNCSAIEASCGIPEEGFVTVRGKIPFEILFKTNPEFKNIPKFLHPIMKILLSTLLKSPKPHYLYNLAGAQEIKKHVNIPVIVVGGIRKLQDITDIIESEKSDFIAMSKPFIIEPNIVKKFIEEKQTKSKCIDCNFCLIGLEIEPLKCYYGSF